MNFLTIRKDNSWVRVKNYSTYKEALLAGQELAPFNFHIDTGERRLSREEQLGEEVKVTAPRKNKIKALIDNL